MAGKYGRLGQKTKSRRLQLSGVSSGMVRGRRSGRALQQHPPCVLNIGQVPIHTDAQSLLQPKLVVGPADDRFEREADEIAGKVATNYSDRGENQVRPEIQNKAEKSSVLQRAPVNPYSFDEGTFIPANEGTEEAVQREAAGELPSSGHQHDLVSGVQHLQHGGTPLADSVRASMESRFGYDFGKVRVHADREAAQLARKINARAFTTGHNIVFGEAEFAPGTEAGRKLLAHELTHVIQQGQAPSTNEDQAAEHGDQRRLEVSGIDSSQIIRRVQWNPVGSHIMGRWAPWGVDKGIWGTVYLATTDGGSPIGIWKPDDKVTYWCHGFTFGGGRAAGGPFSVHGGHVQAILDDEGWYRIASCHARPGDILVHTNDSVPITHTGIIRTVEKKENGGVDEERSIVRSKWGWENVGEASWRMNVDAYGYYGCYSRNSSRQASGACDTPGDYELMRSPATGGGTHAD